MAGTAVQIVDRLAGLGYVEGIDDPQDARRKLIRLTPRGIDSLVQSAEIFDRLRARWVEKLGADRVMQLESLRTVVPAAGADPAIRARIRRAVAT